jgi:hypothetical protein
METFFDGIKGAGSDIAEDDPQGANGEREKFFMK